MNESQIYISTTLTVKVPPRELWAFLADTDRLNKSIGLPVVNFFPSPDTSQKGHYTARAKHFGITFQYEEFPFDFIKEQHYEVLRRFPFGFMRDVAGGIRMKAVNAGTELEVYGRIAPKTLLSRIAAAAFVKKQAVADVVQATRDFEKQYLVNNAVPHEPPQSAVNDAQLTPCLKTLREFHPDGRLIDRLADHLRNESDLEVISMRPFDLAERWSANRMEVLKLLLYAAKSGLVDLRWTVLCPNCRAASSEMLTLSQLKMESHCDTCDIKFGTDLADSVEARFSVNPAIRQARYSIYCIGGPANMPQIIAQLR
ncbi:MAG TPA: DUF5939 domain-containing protein, partial [Bacteroidota bacterium]|nr:DUF5939 domain-containing protein [Bacteroidota bacterium]